MKTEIALTSVTPFWDLELYYEITLIISRKNWFGTKQHVSLRLSHFLNEQYEYKQEHYFDECWNGLLFLMCLCESDILIYLIAILRELESYGTFDLCHGDNKHQRLVF